VANDSAFLTVIKSNRIYLQHYQENINKI